MLRDMAVEVENLGKQYRVGLKPQRYGTLRDTLSLAAKVPSRFLRRKETGSHTDSHFWALKDVNFAVAQGEVVGIIGHNGAGKSTLLKVLSRITEPTEGRLRLRGRVSSLLEVGTGFHPELSGRENIFLNGAILGMRRAEIEHKFDEIVAFSEVEKFIDTPVKQYSSGMYLRLAFGVAAHLEPEILIVDEVLAVGDMAFQKKCLNKMEDVSRAGRTILFVSHNMGAISNLCRRCLCLKQGRISENGETSAVINAYIAHADGAADGQGFADLRDRERSQNLTSQLARFTWVRTRNGDENVTGSFREGEPIVIEVGFTVQEPVQRLHFGCGVLSVKHGIELFTVPSREQAAKLLPGHYAIRLRLDPNYLREGLYSLTLKLFAEGVRLDTLPSSTDFRVVSYIDPDADSAHFAQWVAGPLFLPYHWQDIAGIQTDNGLPLP